MQHELHCNNRTVTKKNVSFVTQAFVLMSQIQEIKGYVWLSSKSSLQMRKKKKKTLQSVQSIYIITSNKTFMRLSCNPGVQALVLPKHTLSSPIRSKDLIWHSWSNGGWLLTLADFSDNSFTTDGSGFPPRGLLSFPLQPSSSLCAQRVWRSPLSVTFYLFLVLCWTPLSSFLHVQSAADKLRAVYQAPSVCVVLDTKEKGGNFVMGQWHGGSIYLVNIRSYPVVNLKNQM